jgi:hypothetical protein
MGMIAVTAIVDGTFYLLRLRKTNFRFLFPLQQTKGTLLFPFSVCNSKQKFAEFWKHGDMETDMET